MDLCEVIMKTENLVWSQAQKEAVADRILSSKRISLQKKLDFISLFFDLPCVFDSLMLKPYLSLIQARYKGESKSAEHCVKLWNTEHPL